MSVLLYHSIVEKRDVPLHYYCLFVDSDKPPIFFLGWSQLGVAQVKPLGPRYYENHPNPKFVTNIKAAKFLHENRFVWVLEEATKSLGEVNNEKEIASLRQS